MDEDLYSSKPHSYPRWCSNRRFGFAEERKLRGFKDSLAFIYRLKLNRCFEAHDGCVNTIQWNQTGQLILSGSDDLLLKISNPFEGRVLTSIQSGHRSNIFTAKFLPFSDDAKIVSCSGDGQMIYTEVLRPETYGTFRFTCHQGSTSSVETINEEPFSVMSCGEEDGTVRLFDLRTKNSCRKRSRCSHDVIYKSCCGVSNISVNQLVPYQFAVCCTDGIVRLMDRRFMDSSGSNRNLKGAFIRFCPLRSTNESENRDVSVKRRITSVKFCPSTGEEVLVSYSGDSLFLFGLDGKYSSVRRRANQINMCTERAVSEEEENRSEETSAIREELSDSSEVGRRSIFRRLRIRGDWSDTGPRAMPLQPTPSSAQTQIQPQANNPQSSSGVESGSSSEENVNRRRNIGMVLSELLEQRLAPSQTAPVTVEDSVGAEVSTNRGESVSGPPSVESTLGNSEQGQRQERAGDEGRGRAEVGVVRSDTEGVESSDEDSMELEAQRHQSYIRQVREEVRNAPVTDEEQSFSGMVFVRDEMNSQQASDVNETDASAIRVYIGLPTTPSEHNHTPREEIQHSSQNAAAHSEMADDSDLQGADPGNTRGTRDSEPSSETPGRSDNNRWANVTSGLLNMIRSQNRAAGAMTRRSNLLRGVPTGRMRRRRLSGDSSEGRDSSGGEEEGEGEGEEAESEGDDQQKKDSEILGLLGLQNAAVRVKYSGHRNTRTMIKQANFWGDEFVVTGSDCGHIFFYERYSGKLVTVLEADKHVVNCVQPHPSNCILASSGIDYNIKLWVPTGPPGLGAPPHMLQLIERNLVMQRQTRDLITVPASFMLRLLAIASARQSRSQPDSNQGAPIGDRGEDTTTLTDRRSEDATPDEFVLNDDGNPNSGED